MSEIEKDPEERSIDEGVFNSDSVMIFHNISSEKEFEAVKNRIVDLKQNDIVYIHYYSMDNTYTLGLKNKKKTKVKKLIKYLRGLQ